MSGSRLIPVEAEPLTEPAVGAGSVVFLPKCFWLNDRWRIQTAPGDLTRDEPPSSSMGVDVLTLNQPQSVDCESLDV